MLMFGPKFNPFSLENIWRFWVFWDPGVIAQQNIPKFSKFANYLLLYGVIGTQSDVTKMDQTLKVNISELGWSWEVADPSLERKFYKEDNGTHNSIQKWSKKLSTFLGQFDAVTSSKWIKL